MTQELNLPKIPNMEWLLKKADADPRMNQMAGALILAAATGIQTYRDIAGFPGQSEAERLTFAIEEAARHFMLLAATHGIT